MATKRNPNLRDGDLEHCTLVEHIENPKRYLVTGTFVGSSEEIILCRIGEGDDDPRSPETIRITAEHIQRAVISLYSTNAMLSRRKEREGAVSETG